MAISRASMRRQLSPSGKRNYRSEYKNYQSTTTQKKSRAGRNTARRKMAAAGKVRKGDGKDVAHRNGNPRDNRKSNLKVVSASKNRSFKRTRTARKANKKA